MNIIAAMLVTMSVTAYVPAAGGINGTGRMADGTLPTRGHAACGYKYPFGTVFEFTEDVSKFGLPQVVECRDRGGMVGNRSLDIVIQTGDVRNDLALAREWGKRRIQMRIYQNRDIYNAQLAEQQAIAAARLKSNALGQQSEGETLESLVSYRAW